MSAERRMCDHHAGVSVTSSPSSRSLGYTLGLAILNLCCQYIFLPMVRACFGKHTLSVMWCIYSEGSHRWLIFVSLVVFFLALWSCFLKLRSECQFRWGKGHGTLLPRLHVGATGGKQEEHAHGQTFVLGVVLKQRRLTWGVAGFGTLPLPILKGRLARIADALGWSLHLVWTDAVALSFPGGRQQKKSNIMLEPSAKNEKQFRFFLSVHMSPEKTFMIEAMIVTLFYWDALSNNLVRCIAIIRSDCLLSEYRRSMWITNEDCFNQACLNARWLEIIVRVQTWFFCEAIEIWLISLMWVIICIFYVFSGKNRS